MAGDNRTVLVLGATGQQGGSVATALTNDGWHVRALVRDPDGDRSRALSGAGVETVRGNLADTGSVRAAMVGAYGVFSVQPSSGQATSGLSDADEVRFGTAVAGAAQDAGVEHLVYSSSNAAGPATGVGHFDSKFQVEEYVRGLALDTTIVRPSTSMELLLLPDFGLPEGRLAFFMRPDQAMQFIAVENIGTVVAAVFDDRDTHRNRTIEIAGDSATGHDLATRIGLAAGRPISYRRFPDSVLHGNRMLERLTGLVDAGPLAGTADLAALRQRYPGLLSFDSWLAKVNWPTVLTHIDEH